MPKRKDLESELGLAEFERPRPEDADAKERMLIASLIAAAICVLCYELVELLWPAMPTLSAIRRMFY